MITLEKGETVSQKVDDTIDDFDKWGSCGCIQLEKGKYLFYGWAAE